MKIPAPPTKADAVKLASDYAAKQGYDGINYVSDNYTSSTVIGPSYLFRVIQEPKKGEKPKLVGLPLSIVVDKITGNIYETRTL